MALFTRLDWSIAGVVNADVGTLELDIYAPILTSFFSLLFYGCVRACVCNVKPCAVWYAAAL